MNPFSSQTRLRDMIRAIRACKTSAEERAVIRKECAAIRASISESDRYYMHRNLAKLMFIHMLGYPTHFGQMECLKLIASPGFPEKRIGYLALMLLLDERQEVLMLVTNSIKRDLNHTNQYIVGLALCALGNICSAEMARDLSPEIERLLQFRDPNIRKKAALCSIRIIKKVPDLAENFMKPTLALLKEKHHGVLVTGVQLCEDLCKVSTEALEYYRKKSTDSVVRSLKDIANSPYAPDYDVSGINDPFLQIRLLKLLRVLGHKDVDASDFMSDILAQVASKTETNRNAGNAILYECVGTIMGIEENSGLRVLAINILGRFLAHRDNNIRYVALNMLMRAITVDSQAIQRHRATILECVKDTDASLRKRALELVYLLANETNIQSLTKELTDYLEVSDLEFRGDLSANICSMVEKFSPNKIWYIDQMLKVLFEAGNYVKDEVWHALVVVITNTPNLHGYSVRSLYKAVQIAGEQETLARVAVWCIGEYGDMLINGTGVLDMEDPVTVRESDAVDVVEVAIKCHSFDERTQGMCLNSLLKLSSRFPSCSERIKEIIILYKRNLILELQQRAIEYNSIVQKHQNIRSTLVERMPVLDEATYSGRRGGSVSLAASTSEGPFLNLPTGVSKTTSPPLVDLLDLSSDVVPPPSSSGGDLLQDVLGVDVSSASSQSGANLSQKSGTDVLLDLLSIETPPSQVTPLSPEILSVKHQNKKTTNVLDTLLSPSAQVASPAKSSSIMDLLDDSGPNPSVPGGNGPAYPSIVAFESNSLRVTFNFSKEPGSSQITIIDAHFTNKSPNVYTDFIFQAAVPKYLQLHLEPASNDTLPPCGDGSITQVLRVTNNQHGKKSLLMRVRIFYKANGNDALEEGRISNFPRGL